MNAMRLNRRQTIAGALSGALVASAALASPAVMAAGVRRRKGRQDIAILVPLTGASAALGRSVERAAALQGSQQGPIPVFDTAQAGGASAAATHALRKGARCLIGPIFSEDVRAVATLAGERAVVLALSNDNGLRDSGAFLLGVTATQATAAVLAYAAGRGVRNVAVVGVAGDRWDEAVAAEAERLEGIVGLSVRRFAVEGGAAVLAGTDAWTPHAALVAGGGDPALALARSLRGQGLQLLGTHQLIDHRPDALAALDGVWIAAPDPEAFERFAGVYADHATGPGLVAALGYDAAMIAGQMSAAATLDRAGLVATDRFVGATGALRFRSDGSCIREMAILLAGRGGYEVIDRRAGG